jgi:hypothetical protein
MLGLIRGSRERKKARPTGRIYVGGLVLTFVGLNNPTL